MSLYGNIREWNRIQLTGASKNETDRNRFRWHKVTNTLHPEIDIASFNMDQRECNCKGGREEGRGLGEIKLEIT